MAAGFQVTFDCAGPDRLARFWAELLGYELQPAPGEYPSWEAFLRASGVPEDQWDAASAAIDPAGVGPTLYFQRVPEHKVGKNGVHLDINVGGGRSVEAADRAHRVDAAVERAVALGGQRLREHANDRERWVTMADPEGLERQPPISPG